MNFVSVELSVCYCYNILYAILPISLLLFKDVVGTVPSCKGGVFSPGGPACIPNTWQSFGQDSVGVAAWPCAFFQMYLFCDDKIVFYKDIKILD